MGLGLNISLSGIDTSDIEQPWTDLASLGYGEIDRNRIASRCLDAWIDLCRDYGNAGFEQYRRDWSQFDAYAGQEVVVSRRFGDKFTGKIQGVSNIGALIVREHDGTNHLLSDAEASIRLA
jgi:BirA family biotin operon repressor/biotin-[acetyl-CoA-carboxylase] ligase